MTKEQFWNKWGPSPIRQKKWFMEDLQKVIDHEATGPSVTPGGTKAEWDESGQ